MGFYVIAVGGTGNKILESIVYAACADAFYLTDEKGARRPIAQLDMLSVDVDASCGNTTRAQRAAEYYETVRAAFSKNASSHRCFHTALSIHRWNMNLNRRALSVEKMAQNHAADRLLARALFTPTEASLEYSEGFRGHPDLGVLFFADLLNSLDELRQTGQPDELNDLIDRMEADIQRGETVRLLLCGSIFGGTGASGIPAISKYLRARFRDQADLFIMGSLLMLPYYSVPAANVDENRELVVSSDLFLDKARTALQYYGMDGMLRTSQQDASGIYDAVYLLGLPPEAFVPTRLYSTGSQTQKNDAHLLEWLGTRCAAVFMRTGFRGQDAHHMDCYYYQWHTPTLCWDSFDEDALFYRDRYGALMKAAAVYLTECYPILRDGVARAKRRCLQVGYCAPYFSGARHFSAGQRALAEKRLDALYRFFSLYTNWMRQVLTVLPPSFSGGQDCLFRLDLLNLLSQTLERDDPEACAQVQRGLHRLLAGSLPDKRDIGAVIGGLGGAAGYTGPQADAAFAAFVSSLLNVVMETV